MKRTPEKLPAGQMMLTLEAVPNHDFRPGSHQATVRVPAKQVPVAGLAEARLLFDSFVRKHDLGGGNLTLRSGLVTRDGIPFASISSNFRIWKVDEKTLEETGVELDDQGEVIKPGGGR